jgi:hypothetical protein
LNTRYTVAISNTDTGNWGLQILPTRVKQATGSAFGQPSRNFPPCAANSSATAAGYVFYSFTAEYEQYFVDTYEILYKPASVSFDSYAFVYSGANSPPQTCPSSSPLIAEGPTGTNGPVVFSTNVGQVIFFLLISPFYFSLLFLRLT